MLLLSHVLSSAGTTLQVSDMLDAATGVWKLVLMKGCISCWERHTDLLILLVSVI